MSYPNSPPWTPDDIELIRRENLQQLIEEHGGIELLAQRTGMLEIVLENYLSPPRRQIAGIRGPMSDDAAAQIERLTDSPPGWMSAKRPNDDRSNRWRTFFARVARPAGLASLPSELDVSAFLAKVLHSSGASLSTQARTVRLGEDLQIQWAFEESPAHRGKAVSLLMRIESALIGSREIVLNSRGVGIDEAAAARDALANVGQTPLEMLARALAGQRSESLSERPGWRFKAAAGAWTLSHHVWPLQPASLVENLDSLAVELSELLLRDSSPEAYWLQISLTLHEGSASYAGIRRCGLAWPQAQRMLTERVWPTDTRYRTVNQFVLALPD